MAPANYAFVFLKPQAANDAAVAEVKRFFSEHKVHVISKGEVTGRTIDEKKYIDQHYYAIAAKATVKKPHELAIPAEKFEAKFGEKWADVCKTNAYNAKDACEKLDVDSEGLGALWKAAQSSGVIAKLGGGCYCAKVKDIYVFNGFFMSMCQVFVAADAKIKYFVVEFKPSDVSWADFRGKLLGPTDPALAPADSLRGIFYKDWEKLGLAAQPDTGNNSIHASASPFEGLAERVNWLGATLEKDPFARILTGAGVTKATIKAWCNDPRVSISNGAFGKIESSVFDYLEDSDVDECAARCMILAQTHVAKLAAAKPIAPVVAAPGRPVKLTGHKLLAQAYNDALPALAAKQGSEPPVLIHSPPPY